MNVAAPAIQRRPGNAKPGPDIRLSGTKMRRRLHSHGCMARPTLHCFRHAALLRSTP